MDGRPARAPTVERWTPPAPPVPAELILRLQHYPRGAAVPPAVRDAALAAAAEATALARPEAVLWRGPVTVVADTVRLDSGPPLHSRALARLLGGASDAYVVLLTLGAAIEERVRARFDARDLLESVLLDTAAWAALEILARDVRVRLRAAERAAGRTVTHRLGPGHADWLLDEQPALLAVFGAMPLPVRLNEAACMIPQKSITGVFGVVPAR